MIEKICNVRTADGEMETFTARPAGDGPFPAVVLYMDAPGIRGSSTISDAGSPERATTPWFRTSTTGAAVYGSI